MYIQEIKHTKLHFVHRKYRYSETKRLEGLCLKRPLNPVFEQGYQVMRNNRMLFRDKKYEKTVDREW